MDLLRGSNWAPLNASWAFAPFSAQIGTLVSVEISGIVSVVAYITEHNFSAAPLSFGDSHLHSWFNDSGWVMGPLDDALGGPGAIAPQSSLTITRDLQTSYSATVTNPAQLDFYRSGTAPLVAHNALMAFVNFGEVSGTGTANLTLTYKYSVPDGSTSSASLLALGLIIMFACSHRRINRNFPTL